MSIPDCLFCKIVAGDINADIIFQTDDVIAFRDINPQAPTHVVIIPRRHISTINDIADSDAELVGAMVLAAKEIAAQEDLSAPGYRLNMNCNAAGGQTVFHVHLHLLGGRNFTWPPG